MRFLPFAYAVGACRVTEFKQDFKRPTRCRLDKMPKWLETMRALTYSDIEQDCKQY
jgi:hypothetical protein